MAIRSLKVMWVYFTPASCEIGTPHCFATYKEAVIDFNKMRERKEWKWVRRLPYEEPEVFTQAEVETNTGVRLKVNFQKVSRE